MTAKGYTQKIRVTYRAPARERRNNMRIYASAGIRLLYLAAALALVDCAFAQQAPWGLPNVPISTHDRVYAADQTSNTVSVIDPSSNKLLGVIRLGSPCLGHCPRFIKDNFSSTALATRPTPERWR